MYSRVFLTLQRQYQKSSIYQQNVIKLVKRNHSDVVVIGGGAMGSSTAYWLKEKASRSKKNINVTVIEKDLTYSKCSTALSVGGIRQQFSIAENIQMSMYGANFINTLKKRFGPEADISYMPYGYLILASEKGVQQLEENYKLQTELGVKNELLTKKQLKQKFSWLNVDDIELGCLGFEKEGWFDPWGLLSLLKSAAVSKGVKFVHGETVGFHFGNSGELRGVQVMLPNKEKKTLNFDYCVLAAGAESGKIAKLAKIGTDPSSVSLPVERRKRFVYRFDTQGTNCPPLKTPLTIDYTGAYFRRDGGSYIAGISPKLADEPSTDDLEVDFEYFDRHLWPLLACRVPAFESIKIKSAWSGFYEYNTFDENGIVGAHPFYKNLIFATGFSGHGIQQSPAVGLAVAELILDGRFQNIDLARFGFERLIKHKPMYETEIY